MKDKLQLDLVFRQTTGHLQHPGVMTDQAVWEVSPRHDVSNPDMLQQLLPHASHRCLWRDVNYDVYHFTFQHSAEKAPQLRLRNRALTFGPFLAKAMINLLIKNIRLSN